MRKKSGIKRLFVVILLMISITSSSLLFGGCKLFSGIMGNESGSNTDFSDDELTGGDETNLQNEDMFKVAYKPDSDYTIGIQYQLYASEIISQLVRNYGNGYYNNIFNGIDNKLFYDSIRYHSQETTLETGDYVVGDMSSSWIWTFGIDYVIKMINSTILITSEEDEDVYLLEKSEYYNTVEYFFNDTLETYKYDKWYSKALELVMYDILLGKTPREYEVTIDPESGTPSIMFGEIDLADYVENAVQINSLVEAERAHFNKKATYVGFTKNDMETLKTYILEKVIGENAVNAGAETEFDRKYEEFLDELFETYITPSITPLLDFRAYPYATYKDTKLLGMSDNDDPFSHIVSGEYNSLVFMPTEAEQLSFIWLCFQAEEDVDLKLYFRYFNSSSGVLATTEDEAVSVHIPAGEYNSGDYESVDMPRDWGNDSFVNVDEFDNNESRAAKEPQMIVGVGSIYKTISSINGFGGVTVLDESKIDFSFVEVVIDIVRNDVDFARDYNFKMAVWLRA